MVIGRLSKSEKIRLAHSAIRKNIPKKEIVEKIAALSTAAFGLVAALAWNDMIKGFFRHYFGDKGNLLAQFIYAMLVTILAVLVAIYVARLSSKLKQEEEKKEEEIEEAEQSKGKK